jgi:hypothetical protein
VIAFNPLEEEKRVQTDVLVHDVQGPARI